MNHRLRFPAPAGQGAAGESGAQRPPTRDRRAGFSLIELLTVIAIIAILAAVIFPVANVVRTRAQHSQVISNMKSIQTALGIYKLDEHGYPPTLGPVTFGNTTYNGMFPEWLKDREAFHSAANEVEDPNALVPVDLNASAPTFVSDGLPAGAVDPARQSGAKFNAWNTMDGHVGPKGYVLHYSRYRTLDRNDLDYKRQLGFRNPPEDTVVTWNDTFVRKGDDGSYVAGDLFVLFLNGTVKKFDVKSNRVKEVRGQFWRLKPY